MICSSVNRDRFVRPPSGSGLYLLVTEFSGGRSRGVIGMDIHRTFAEVMFWENGRLRPGGTGECDQLILRHNI
jgi:hypothetical protein